MFGIKEFYKFDENAIKMQYIPNSVKGFNTEKFFLAICHRISCEWSGHSDKENNPDWDEFIRNETHYLIQREGIKQDEQGFFEISHEKYLGFRRRILDAVVKRAQEIFIPLNENETNPDVFRLCKTEHGNNLRGNLEKYIL